MTNVEAAAIKLGNLPRDYQPTSTTTTTTPAQQYLVFYVRGARFGSLPLTADNLSGMLAECYMQLIQTDVTGTQHYNILGVKRKSRMHDRRRPPTR